MRRCCQLSAWGDGLLVQAFRPRMVCTRCGIIGADARPNWRGDVRGRELATELRRSYMTASGLPASDHGSQSGDEDVALEGLIEPELLIVAGQLRQPLMSSARAGRRLSISISIRPRDASLQSRQ